MNNVLITYSRIENPYDLIIIKLDKSYAAVGDFEIGDIELWDMADQLEVEGWNIVKTPTN